MSVKSSIDIEKMKEKLKNMLSALEAIEEWGYAVCPTDMNKKYEEESKKIIELLSDADNRLDDLVTDSEENFGY